MRIIQIQGGLGNQLFLYVYYQWQLKNCKNEKIYGVYPQRGLAAHNGLEIKKWFNVSMPIATTKSTIIGNTCFWLNKILRILHLPIPYGSDDVHPRDNALFHDGYYQNLIYQEGVELPSFRPDLEIDNANQEMLAKLSAPNAIAVHVRRGDYNKNAKTKRIYGGICTDEYYLKAIASATKDIMRPHFFFFSDDEEYVRRTFKMENMTIVNINKGERSFFDMYLMAHASNMILANSTFSCWAAYLNKNVQRVYCPSRWVNKEPIPNIIKKDWIIIH